MSPRPAHNRKLLIDEHSAGIEEQPTEISTSTQQAWHLAGVYGNTRIHARTHACVHVCTHVHARTHAHPPTPTDKQPRGGRAHTRGPSSDTHAHEHTCTRRPRQSQSQAQKRAATCALRRFVQIPRTSRLLANWEATQTLCTWKHDRDFQPQTLALFRANLPVDCGEVCVGGVDYPDGSLQTSHRF